MSSSPNPLHHLIYRIAKTTFVVLVRTPQGLTLVRDPGMQKPWSSKLKKHADQVAKEFGGEARTWDDAFNLLKKEYPDFEKHLVEGVDPVALLKGKTN